MESTPGAPQGIVTIAFVDAPEAGTGGSAESLRIVSRVLRQRGGFEVKSRAGQLMVAFASGGDAVRAVVEAQEALSATGGPLARAGIHTGEPLRTEENGVIDYLGLDVNRAARIAAAGHAGQVLISESTRNAAVAVLEAFVTRDLGEHRLRGFERVERLWLVLPAALAERAFPPLATPSARPTNLPPATSAFVGRETELEGIGVLLKDATTRIVTLRGPGGVGKTRLAVRAAAAVLENFRGGVWFADLTAAHGIEGIAQAVALALGVELPPRENPVAAVASMLELRSPILIVLDNFEQLVEHAAASAGAWAARVPAAKLLVTSRIALRVPGETVLDLEPLPSPPPGFVPKDPGDLLTWEAARLFVQRAAAAKPGFEATAENAREIAEICSRLDGMPLAIELAAARATVLRPSDIVARLDRKFDLLRSSQRDLSPRQRTLLGAIEWSFDLLSDPERQAFLQASVFRGGFSAEAASQVIDLSATQGAPPVAEVVASLGDKSLFRVQPGTHGIRFAMYVPIHEYAWQRWRYSADEPRQRELQKRHAEYFASRALQLGERLSRDGGGAAADLLELDSDNILAAHDAALETEDGQLAARLMLGLDPKLDLRGPTAERLKRLDATLAALGVAGPPELRAPLLISYMHACVQAGVANDPVELANDAVVSARASGRPAILANVLARRAALGLQRANESGAVRDLEEAEKLFRSIGDDQGVARVVGTRGAWFRSEGRLDEAEAAFQESGALFAKLGNLLGISQALGYRSQVLCDRGLYSQALDGIRRAESLALEAGALRNAANWRWRMAEVLALAGSPEESAAALTEAEELVRAVGDRRLLARTLHLRGEILTELGDLDGALLRFEEALVYRRVTSDPRGVAITLTRRARTRSMRGDHDGSREDLRTVAAEFERFKDNISLGAVEQELAVTERRAGNPEEALRHLERAESLLDQAAGRASRPELFAQRSRILGMLGRNKEAVEAARAAEVSAREFGFEKSRGMITVFAAHAAAARAAGFIDEAAEAAARGVALATGLGVPLGMFSEETKRELGLASVQRSE